MWVHSLSLPLFLNCPFCLSAIQFTFHPGRNLRKFHSSSPSLDMQMDQTQEIQIHPQPKWFLLNWSNSPFQSYFSPVTKAKGNFLDQTAFIFDLLTYSMDACSMSFDFSSIHSQKATLVVAHFFLPSFRSHYQDIQMCDMKRQADSLSTSHKPESNVTHPLNI